VKNKPKGFMLRIPLAVHSEARVLASARGVSLNTWIVVAMARGIVYERTPTSGTPARPKGKRDATISVTAKALSQAKIRE
jgi:HicB family